VATVTPRVTATQGAVAKALEGRRLHLPSVIVQILLLIGLLTSLGFLAILLVDIFSRGWTVYSDRGLDFVTSGLSRTPGQTGIWQGLWGSAMIAVTVVVVAFPLGIATAIWLEEYAPDNRLTRFVNLNIRNLAGVPSVVYGILGLALFVQLFGIDRGGVGFTGGRSVLSGGLTISVLVLPIVVITTAEALRAVPSALREAAYGVGATRWEVVRTMVLPNAAPGILTGAVLSISRAVGETAPLILVGAVTGGGFLAGGANQSFVEQLRGDYTALPMIVYGWAQLPQDVWRNQLAPAAIIGLLMFTLSANAIAIVVRNRYEKRW